MNESNPASIYLLKVNKINTRTRGEICSKLTIKTPERPITYFTLCSGVSKQVNDCWGHMSGNPRDS